jgi:hypothetical protein
MRETKGACRVLAGESEGTRPLERYRCRWDEKITVDLEVGWGHGLD